MTTLFQIVPIKFETDKDIYDYENAIEFLKNDGIMIGEIGYQGGLWQRYYGTYQIDPENANQICVKLTGETTQMPTGGAKDVNQINPLDKSKTIKLQFFLEEGKFPVQEPYNHIIEYRYKCTFSKIDGNFSMAWIDEEKSSEHGRPIYHKEKVYYSKRLSKFPWEK